MRDRLDRALKEWAVACNALRDGQMSLLIRKGGIREEGGVFRVDDSEFFLLRTHVHQNAGLLRDPWAGRVAPQASEPDQVVIDTAATVELVAPARDEEQLAQLADLHIWNGAYLRQRFNFNPYDPLYVMLLRVYKLAAPLIVPMTADYTGCRSWVTLAQDLPTSGALPSIGEAAFAEIKARVSKALR